MSPACVLVVDDSPTIRRLIEITLRGQGFRVVFAENGITTLAAQTRHQPDLIILDGEDREAIAVNGHSRHQPSASDSQRPTADGVSGGPCA